MYVLVPMFFMHPLTETHGEPCAEEPCAGNRHGEPCAEEPCAGNRHRHRSTVAILCILR